MSLDILKERFSGKPITSQYEDKIESKQKIIDKLELEAQNLSNQVLNLEKEKTFLVQELNKAKKFEDGTFSIKEKDYINELESKELMIKEVEQKTNSLYRELDKKDERLIYKNKIIDNSLKTIKEAKTEINRLNLKLQNSKNSKKELQLEISIALDVEFAITLFVTDTYLCSSPTLGTRDTLLPFTTIPLQAVLPARSKMFPVIIRPSLADACVDRNIVMAAEEPVILYTLLLETTE